jgi:hypothetical protein
VVKSIIALASLGLEFKSFWKVNENLSKEEIPLIQDKLFILPIFVRN